MKTKNILLDEVSVIKPEEVVAQAPATERKENIGYAGKVTIKYLKGNRVVKTTTQHNAGTVKLFELLAKAISCDTTVLAQMPKFIHTYNWDGNADNLFLNSTCVMNVPFSNRKVTLEPDTSTDPTLNSASATVKFEFLIPYTELFGITNVLALYGTAGFNDYNRPDNFNVLAYVVLDDTSVIDMETDDRLNILVEWSLQFNNV